MTLRFAAALESALGTTLSILDFLELPTISEIARLVEGTASPCRTQPEKAIARPRCGCNAGHPPLSAQAEERA